MSINLNTFGLILTAFGALILLLNNIFTSWYNRVFKMGWKKRYVWNGWHPIFKIHLPNEKPKWKIKWNRKIVVYGFIPPRYFWEIIGFLFILIGTILQIIRT